MAWIFVVVNFDALAQASDFRIERRQLVILCRMQDSNPEGLWNPIFSRLNTCWQTDWAIEDQAKKLWLYSPSIWSANIQPTWPHCHLAFAPGSDDIHICCCNFDALAQVSNFRIKRRQLVILCRMQDSNPEGLWNPIFSRLNTCWQTDWAIEDQAKKLWLYSPSIWSANIQPTWPHCHLAFAPGSDDIHICCCNFDALAQVSNFRIKRRQLVFLCWMQDSNPEPLWNPIVSRLKACWQTDWTIKDRAKKLELDSPSLRSASIQPTWPHCHLAFAPGSGDIHICCC